jgi:hypothetical protein
MTDHDDLLALADDDLRDQIDEWCDAWADSHDPGHASIGRDLIYEVTRRWLAAVAGSATPTKETDDG